MTKKERIAYRGMIEGLSHQLIIDAYKAALKVSEQVYRDLLVELDSQINAYLAEHPEENK